MYLEQHDFDGDDEMSHRNVTALDAYRRIEKHEAVCTQRWAETIARLNRMESLLVKGFGALLAAFFTTILFLVGILVQHAGH